MSGSVAAPRRTQQERREQTIAKILTAAVVSLGERGYAATTMQEVCHRSGVSSGGLFRHFPTRVDLMVAAANHVRAQQFENFRSALERVDPASMVDCLRLLRAACRAPINSAWYELLGAARTDTELRERIATVAVEYHAEIAAFARTLPAAANIPSAHLDAVLFTAVHLFDGEAVSSVLDPQPDQDELRLQMLARALSGGSLYE
ncbi:MAG: TetR/AcrR family transcriptional regulator [Rhodococcus sp. (in: high G+C Gram-positive bacteria)]|uniref:TetR/AcrR family transcriptional regulator n=1 Tax=Rhodococcus sp. TaxID=1831 RepID=UPI003BB0D88A